MSLLRILLSVMFLTCSALIHASVPSLGQSGDLQWQGFLTQGGYARLRLPPGTQASLDGNELRLSPEGEAFIAFGRDHGPAARLTWQRAGQSQVYDFAIANRTFNVQNIQGVPQQTVTPDPEQQAVISADSARVRQARMQRLLRTDWRDDFVWPVVGTITGVYGSQRIYNGQPGAPHWGIDIARPEGTPIAAPLSGRVSLADDLFLSGKTIIIDHGYGLTSALLHLSRMDVVPGQIVERGQLVGAVGSTGRSTGPHLDWRVQWQGVWVDPQLLLAPQRPWPAATPPPRARAQPAPVRPPSPSPAPRPNLSAECLVTPLPKLALVSIDQPEAWPLHAQVLALDASVCVLDMNDFPQAQWPAVFAQLQPAAELQIITHQASALLLPLVLQSWSQPVTPQFLLLDPPVSGQFHQQRAQNWWQAAGLPAAFGVEGAPSKLLLVSHYRDHLQPWYRDFFVELGDLRWAPLSPSAEFTIGLIGEQQLPVNALEWQQARDFLRR